MTFLTDQDTHSKDDSDYFKLGQIENLSQNTAHTLKSHSFGKPHAELHAEVANEALISRLGIEENHKTKSQTIPVHYLV